MYYYNYYYDTSYFVFMIISVLVAGFAHFKVQSAFNKYSRVKSRSNLTGKNTAEKLLEHCNILNIQVEHTRGFFSDYFNPNARKICLSESVYNQSHISAISVAAHETGHAMQYSEGYFPLKLRHALVPITRIGSNLAMPLIIIGFALPAWAFMVNFGIMLFSLTLIFQLVTLPVEFDASRRALKYLKNLNILDESEIYGAKKVLTAAALTYVASAFTSLLSLVRLILVANNRKK